MVGASVALANGSVLQQFRKKSNARAETRETFFPNESILVMLYYVVSTTDDEVSR